MTYLPVAPPPAVQGTLPSQERRLLLTARKLLQAKTLDLEADCAAR